MRKIFNKNRLTSTKGSSLIMMIAMISVLVIISFTLLIVVLSFFKLGKIYMASEDLYYTTNRAAQYISSELENELVEILKGINIYETSDEGVANKNISDTTLTLICSHLKTKYLLTENLDSLKNTVNGKLISFIENGDTSGALDHDKVKKDLTQALFDITFRMIINENGSTQTEVLKNKTALENGVLDLLIGQDEFEDKKDSYEYVYFKVEEALINKDKVIQNETSEWLADILNIDESTNTIISGSQAPYKYYRGPNADPEDPDPSITDPDLLQQYATITYNIMTKNERHALNKNLQVQYQASSIGFAESDLATRDTQSAEKFTNDFLGKALTASGDITFTENKTVEINGDVYAFSTLPEDMTKPIISKADFGGILFKGSNQTVNISGDVVTRGYLSGEANNSDINITGNAICDSLFINDGNKDIDFTVGGNISTFDDIRVNGSNSNVRIEGNFYGLNYGDIKSVNKSSSLILNDNTSTSTIRVDGQAFIGGLAYAGNIIQKVNVGGSETSYAFKTGESASIGDNYKIYGYRLPDYDSELYPVTTIDFEDWNVIKMGDSSEISLLSPRNTTDTDVFKNVNGGYLRRHFYNYVKNKSGDDILYNFEPFNRGIILNSDKEHYALGIVCAQMYSNPSSIPATGSYYWLYGTPPWGVGSPPAGFAIPNKTPLSPNDYNTEMYGADMIDNGVGGKKADAINEISFIKIYDDTVINPNSGENKALEFTDVLGFLKGNGSELKYNITNITDDGSLPNEIYYLTNDNKNLIIGNENEISDGKINADRIKGKKVLIYTRGDIEIKPTSNLNISGVIIANGISSDSGGNINIDTKDGSFTLTHDTEAFDRYRKVREFFGPGNYVDTTFENQDVYRSTRQNTRLVDKKLIK